MQMLFDKQLNPMSPRSSYHFPKFFNLTLPAYKTLINLLTANCSLPPANF